MIVPMLAVIIGATLVLTLTIFALGELGPITCNSLQGDPEGRNFCRDSITWMTGIFGTFVYLLLLLPAITLVLAIWMWRQ